MEKVQILMALNAPIVVTGGIRRNLSLNCLGEWNGQYGDEYQRDQYCQRDGLSVRHVTPPFRCLARIKSRSDARMAGHAHRRGKVQGEALLRTSPHCASGEADTLRTSGCRLV